MNPTRNRFLRAIASLYDHEDNRAMADDLFEDAPAPLACIQRDGRLCRVNAAFQAVFQGQAGDNFLSILSDQASSSLGMQLERHEPAMLLERIGGLSEITFKLWLEPIAAGNFLMTCLPLTAAPILQSQSILERISDGLFILDTAWRFTYINAYGAALIGKTPAEVTGQIIWDIYPPEAKLTFYAHYQRAMNEQVVVRFEAYYAPLERWYEVSAYPSPRGLTVFYHDISARKATQTILEEQVQERTQLLEETINALAAEVNERRETQEMLAVSQERLVAALAREQELNDLKMQFIKMIDHEFRTPMSIISTSADLILRYGERVDRQLHLAKIRNSVYTMEHLLSEGLRYVIQAEQEMLILKEMLALEELSQAVIASVAQADRAHPELEIIGTARPILSDRRILSSTLRHILLNAVEHTPPTGRLSLRLHYTPDFVQMVIADTGVGIPAEDLVHIFEPFFRGRKVNRQSGMGLGLASAQRDIEALGGNIEVVSNEGVGTTVIITLNAV